MSNYPFSALPRTKDGAIPIHVTVRALKETIEGVEEGVDGKYWLKVRLTAVPEDGKANKALLKLLAKAWGVPVSRLRIASGETSRYKLVKLDES